MRASQSMPSHLTQAGAAGAHAADAARSRGKPSPSNLVLPRIGAERGRTHVVAVAGSAHAKAAGAARAPPSNFVLTEHAAGDKGGGTSVATAGGRGPLVEIEALLKREMSRVNIADEEQLLQVHAMAFERFIEHFHAYAAPLSAIKKAYEGRIDGLQGELSAVTRRHESAQREFHSTHESIVGGLSAQLEKATRDLAAAKKELKTLQDCEAEAGDGGEEEAVSSSTAGGGSKVAFAGLPAAGGGGGASTGAAPLLGGFGGGKGWAFVAKTLDADPRTKISRLLRAAARLCTSPPMLTDAAGVCAVRSVDDCAQERYMRYGNLAPLIYDELIASDPPAGCAAPLPRAAAAC